MTDTTDWSDEDKDDLSDYEETEGSNVPADTCDPEDFGFSSN